MVSMKSQEASKPQQQQQHTEENEVVIPGLPRPLAYKCLARVPRESHFCAISVCKAWRKAFVSGEVYRLRKELGVVEPWIYLAFSPGRGLRAAGRSCRTWLEAYDPGINLWHSLGPVPGLPERHTLKGFAFVALAHKLYAVGGRLTRDDHGINMQEEVIRKEVLAFDCTTREWSQCASMSIPRVNFACTVCSGRIYVAGGRSTPGQEKGVSSAEVYIPEENYWVPLPGMSTGRYKCVGVTSEEKIHVVGGFAGPEESDKLIQPFNIDRSCVDVFHPPSGQWTLLKGMWQLDVPPNQIVTLEGRLYSSGDALNTWKGRIEVYDTALNMWKIVEGSWLPMTHPEVCSNSERCYLTMAPIAHRLYFLGGYRLPSDESGTFLHTVYIFDTIALDAASRWQLVEPVQDTCKELCSHCCVVSL